MRPGSQQSLLKGKETAEPCGGVHHGGGGSPLTPKAGNSFQNKFFRGVFQGALFVIFVCGRKDFYRQWLPSLCSTFLIPQINSETPPSSLLGQLVFIVKIQAVFVINKVDQ